ncbi:hypothetical protein B0O99DRAFT_660164 [Bisporella sp. PMI_857]|nr:hypothetical protein B0O99DRAFT_660164 [Bisporella sp. PMI_857]
MAAQLKDKTALVTGAGSGICLAFAKLLLANGCNVVIADLQLLPEAQSLVTETTDAKPKAIFKKTDVTDWNELQAAFDIALEEFGGLHIVCPGAGIFEPLWSSFFNFDGGVDNNSTSSYKTLDINVNHPILPIYSASKHAISGFVRCLAPLDISHKIRVNAVAPGIVKTPIWTQSKDKLLWFDDNVDTWVTPEEVADVMLDLIVNDEWVGGTILEVGSGNVRSVQAFNDPGPQGSGHQVSNANEAVVNSFALIKERFGK